MNEITARIESVIGESARHLTTAALEAGLHALPAAPKDTGRLMGIVRRPTKDARELLSYARLSPEAGLPGDNWSQKPAPDPTAQLTVMQTGVAELIANGQSLALFGDNLFVDLDLSVANLPVGSRLRVGAAVVEVTPMPHDGCRKFKARFGNDALHFVNAKPTRSLNLRGIYWRVIEAGDIEVGSLVQVLSRPAPAQ
ncbi:MAG: MOSC domain-containing protein [Verrucomicrobia bacterium]|nr:MOSC domain-containing protein [Verrucomicrobiota bacterium]